MKKGFMLIELLIATLITSMISILLLTVLQQSTKFQSVIDNNINVHTRAIICYQQLEKDIMGTFVPIQDNKNTKQKNFILEHIFYSTNQNKKLNTLTFVTTSSLAVYWGEKTGKAKPRVARVVYQLQPESEKKDSFVLFRQEGTDLSFSYYKKDNPKAPRTYQLINGIKDLSITYTQVENQKDQSKKPVYKTVNTWNWPLKEKKGNKKEPILPNFITVHLVLWDNDYKNDSSFTFTCTLLAEEKLVESQQKKLNQLPAPNTKSLQNQIKQNLTLQMGYK